jgi:large subunit ribosomal protein L17
MRHQVRKKTLGRKAAPRKAMLHNLATSILLYEKVTTTKVKAKVVKPMVEKAITTGRENTLENRRKLMKLLFTKKAVDKTLEVIGPRYKERKGGYTRIVPLGKRQGDGADVVRIELV